MHRILMVCLVSAFLLPLTGCGASGAYGQHASFCQEENAAIASLTEAFQTVKDKESAKTALPSIGAALDRYEKLPARAAALPKLNAREASNLEREYRTNLISLTLRMENASRQAVLDSKGDKDMKAAVKRLNVISKDIAKKLWEATH